MLIVKGGISREIDEKDLQVYLDKGYKPVKIEPVETEREKSLIKMTTAELEAKAIEIGVDISDCKNNAERVHKIQQAQDSIAAQEGGE